MIPRYFVVAEALHELQNPTSREQLVLLGERLGLGPGSRVLDIGSGGPAPDFHAVALGRAGLPGSPSG